ESVVGIRNEMRQEGGTGNIEPELIPAKRGYALPVLFHFVRNRVKNVIAEVFVHPSMSAHFWSLAVLGVRRAFGAHPQVAREDFEFVGRLGKIAGRLGR